MKTIPVEYYCRGLKIVGTKYLPDDYVEGTKLPCIIPTSGITGLNAVYPALMARMLTKHGYGCLGFDFRGWKPSEGDVSMCNFNSEYEDIEASYYFATQQPEFDPEKIGLFCWGFSGPVGIRFAADNWGISCVAIGNSFANGERAFRNVMSFDYFKHHVKFAREDIIRRVLHNEGATNDCYLFNQPEDDSLDGKSDYINGTIRNLAPGLAEQIAEWYDGLEKFPPRQPWTWWNDHLRIDAEEYVGKLGPRGLFIAAGEDDTSYDALHEGEQLAKAAGANAVLFPVHGKHNDFMYDDHPEFLRMSKALVAFYDKYMK